MLQPTFTTEQRAALARIFFGWILVAILWRWDGSSMLAQLEAPVLGNVYKDLTFWCFQLLGIQDGLTGHRIPGLLIDVVLTASVVLAFIRPKGVLFPRLYSATVLVYFITHSTYANHHYRPIIGIVVAGLPFIFHSLERCTHAFQALRYYILFVYVSAGLYKVFRGSWLNMDQMTGIIENTQLELLVTHPDGWHAQLFTWLLQHEGASWVLFFVATVLELAFLVGFFTRSWDYLLFLTAITLHIGFYFSMGFFAYELIVLDLTVLPWHRILPPGGSRDGIVRTPVV